MFHFIEREFRLAPLPLLLMIMATAIILRAFYMIMDRPQTSYASEHDVVAPEAQPQPRQQRLAPIQAHRPAQRQPQARTQVYRQAQTQKVYSQPRAWPQNYHARQPTRITRATASNGRGPASIGPRSVSVSVSGLRFQPQSHFQPGIQKKSTSFLAKVIGKDAVRDLKEIITSEERTEYFLQRELNVTDSDIQLIKDEKMRLYAKLRELDQKGEPTKIQQERTTLLQQHKAWMESVLGAEGYQRLQQIRGL